MLGGVLANIQGPVYMPDPRIYDFSTWTAEVASGMFKDAPAITTEERWYEWADYLSSTSAGLQYGLPSSVGFDDWKSWAIRAYQVVM